MNISRRRLRVEDAPLPRLIYLSACSGMNLDLAASGHRRAGDRETREGNDQREVRESDHPKNTGDREASQRAEREALAAQPSTAAALHRGGFAQVVGYFGPVGNPQATRLAARFYSCLARGQTARSALRAARELATAPLEYEGQRLCFPLGWAQIALYHRGEDYATALASTDRPVFEAPPARAFVRLDLRGGVERVEQRHDVPLIGVQQLRAGFGFIGRRGPRAQALRRWREGRRVPVVQGLGGLGKTTLCAELLRLLPAPRVLALDGRFAGAQPDPIAGLWREVQAACPGDQQWSLQLGRLQQGGLTPRSLAGALTALTERTGGLIVYLDDAESLQEKPGASRKIGRWRDDNLRECWRLLVAMAENDGPFGLVASSRYRPEGTPEAAVLNLGEMSDWEILRLLTWMPTLRRLPHGDRAWLTPQLAGHPRTIEWLEVLAAAAERRLSPSGGEFTGDWRGQILEPILAKAGEKVEADLLLAQIWQSLDDSTREHLGRLSVLSAPAPWPAILHLETQEDSGRQLVDAGLLSPFQSPEAEPWWSPHRLVTEMVATRWQGEAASAHRNLGAWYRDHIGDDEVGNFAQRAIDHLCAGDEGNAAFPIARELVLTFRRVGRFREALAWIERLLAAGVTGPQRGRSLTLQVQLLELTGVFFANSESLLAEALGLVESAQRGEVLYALGHHYFMHGKLADSACNFQKAIEALASIHGDESPIVAAPINMLGCVLQRQGDLEGARTQIQRSLDIKESAFGDTPDISIGVSHNQLASVLVAQGDLDGARKHVERALLIKRAVLGSENHPEVAASLHLLAMILHKQGHLDAAKETIEKSIAMHIATFGNDLHHSIAASHTLLAGVLADQGEFEWARRTIERSLAILTSVLPEREHHSFADTLHEFGRILSAQGDLKHARQVMEEALGMKIRIHGTSDHFSVALTEMNLAFLLRKTGETEITNSLLAHAHDVFIRQLGPKHPWTRHSLAK